MISINDFKPPILNKLYRKIKIRTRGAQLAAYMSDMLDTNVFKGFDNKLVVDADADPTEFFSHYDAFSYWATKKLGIDRRQKILDLGSPKMMVASLSAFHDMTSMVLADCKDCFSEVNYVNHDASDPLPFSDDSFNCFTSTVALPLMGLGRYGDKLDPNSLHNFALELDRVMKPDSNLFVSMCLGPNFLSFNNGWFLELDTIKKVFKNWSLIDSTVDLCSSGKYSLDCAPQERFKKVEDAGTIDHGDYRVIFCHFHR